MPLGVEKRGRFFPPSGPYNILRQKNTPQRRARRLTPVRRACLKRPITKKEEHHETSQQASGFRRACRVDGPVHDGVRGNVRQLLVRPGLFVRFCVSGGRRGHVPDGELELQIFSGGYGSEIWERAIAGFQEENPDLVITANIDPNVNEQMLTRWMQDDPPDFVSSTARCRGIRGSKRASSWTSPISMRRRRSGAATSSSATASRTASCRKTATASMSCRSCSAPTACGTTKTGSTRTAGACRRTTTNSRPSPSR